MAARKTEDTAARTSSPLPVVSESSYDRRSPGGEYLGPSHTTADEPAVPEPKVAVASVVPEPEPVAPSPIEDAASEAAKDIKPHVLYRVYGSSAHVTHSDGSDSYHSSGTLLRFAKKPQAFEGQLVEEASASDVKALEGDGHLGAPLMGRAKDDAVEVVAYSDYNLARMQYDERQRLKESS